MTLVIHLDNHGVLAFFQQIADIIVEWGKATYVVTSLLTIHPYMAIVVYSAKIQQGAAFGHRHSLEALLKPNCSLVEKQLFVLRIPVRRNLHGWRLIEVVLNQILWFLGLGIDKETITHRVHTIVVIALFLYINNVVPIAIERTGLVGIHILD